MKSLILLAGLFACQYSRAQCKPFSNEDFVNSIAGLVVDSTLSPFYLAGNAAPCSFKKFDYDEWYKYGLQEAVPLYILNELAKKSFLDTAPRYWQQDKLQQAVSIDEEKAVALLTVPVRQAKKNSSGIAAAPAVFYFSRPEFTDDYQYAVIDMGFRCDNHQCGMGATFIFRQAAGKWRLAGRKIAWGN